MVGLGSPDRGDDAVGPVVARAVDGALAGAIGRAGAGLAGPGLAGAGLSGVSVIEQEDPTDLVLSWDAHDLVVVVDAVVSGAEPGTVRVLEVGETPVSTQTWAALGVGGTHAFGLAEAVELARVLGRLPERVSLVLVEAADVTPGAPLSAAVAAAVPRAVDAVLSAVAGLPIRQVGHVPG